MEYLSVSVQGPADKHIFTAITKIACDAECHILRSQGQVIGKEAAISALIEGQWNCVAKFETTLDKLSKKIGLEITIKRTDPPASTIKLLPYLAQVVALDKPDMLYNICDFFSSKGIQIESMQCDGYTSGPNNTEMLNINLSVNIISDMNIADLREQFMIFCDELNIDGILEPERR